MPPPEARPSNPQQLSQPSLPPPPKYKSFLGFVDSTDPENIRIKQLRLLHKRIKEQQALAKIKRDPNATKTDASLLKILKQSFVNKTKRETAKNRANAAEAYENKAQNLIEDYNKAYQIHQGHQQKAEISKQTKIAEKIRAMETKKAMAELAKARKSKPNRQFKIPGANLGNTATDSQALLASGATGLSPITLGGSRKIRKTIIKYKNNRTRRTKKLKMIRRHK